MSEWISVEDRLPEDAEVVLIAGKPYTNKEVCVSFAMREHGEWWFVDDDFDWFACFEGWVSNGDEVEEDVTHWIPLPEPPEAA